MWNKLCNFLVILFSLSCFSVTAYANTIDLDNDGIPNIIDRDDDNDGITDMQELCNSDWDTSNDKSSSMIQVVIDLDAQESDTSWTLTNPNNNIILSGGGYWEGIIPCIGGCISDEIDVQYAHVNQNGTYTLNMKDQASLLNLWNPDGMSKAWHIGNFTDTNLRAYYEVVVNPDTPSYRWTAIRSENYPNFEDHIAKKFTLRDIGIDGFNCLKGDPNAISLEGNPNYQNTNYAALNNSKLNDKGVVEILDKDNDGVINSMDLDADGDGIPDNVEAQGTQDFIASSITNIDVYGIYVAYGSAGILPVDTDGDLTPDFLDLNSDNDYQEVVTGDIIEMIAINDDEESGLDIQNLTIDQDGNGIADELNATYEIPNGDISNPITDLKDEDSDADRNGDLDFRDADNDPYAQLTLALNIINDDSGVNTGDNWEMQYTGSETGYTKKGKSGDTDLTNKPLSQDTYTFTIDDIEGYAVTEFKCEGGNDNDLSDGLFLLINQVVTCTYTVNDIDTLAPLVTISSNIPANKDNHSNYLITGTCGTKSTDLAVNLSVSGTTIQSQEVNCDDDAQWEIIVDLSEIVDGENAITIDATQNDIYNNLGTANQVQINKDVIAPTINVIKNGEANDAGNQLTFSGSVIGQANEDINIYIGHSGSMTSCDTVNSNGDWECLINLTSFNDGSHQLQAHASDPSGNTISGSAISIEVEDGAIENENHNDETAPVVSINSDQAINLNNQNNYTITGSCGIEASDGAVFVSVESITSIPLETVCNPTGYWSATFNLSTLVDGQEAVVINAQQPDQAGNIGNAAEVRLIKDTNKPSLTVNSNGVVNSFSNQIEFSGTVNGDSQELINIYIKREDTGSQVLCAQVISGKNWNCVLSLNSFTVGDHFVQVIAIDQSGNEVKNTQATVSVQSENNSAESEDPSDENTVINGGAVDNSPETEAQAKTSSSGGGSFNFGWLLMLFIYFKYLINSKKKYSYV